MGMEHCNTCRPKGTAGIAVATDLELANRPLQELIYDPEILSRLEIK